MRDGLISRSSGYRTRRGRHGAAATEAAIVLPILLTMVFGAVDFARVMGLSAELTNAVRVGADYGATNYPTATTYNSWSAQIKSTLLDDLNSTKDFDTSKVTITVNLSTDAQGNQQVQVTANYVFTTLVSWPLLPNQVPLQARIVMRQYR